MSGYESLSIWDVAEGRRRRDAALELVDDPPWRAFALVALRAVAGRQAIVSSDDVWAELDEMRIPRPAEGRAMGPVMIAGVRDGILVPAGYGQAGDPRHHASIMRLYRSTIA